MITLFVAVDVVDTVLVVASCVVVAAAATIGVSSVSLLVDFEDFGTTA